MLQSIHIEGFRCLRDVEIDFAPLTVLVGPNGAGKSAILDALRQAITLHAGDLWRRRGGLARSGLWASGPFQVKNQPAPWTSQKLHLHPTALRQQNTVEQAFVMIEDGSNFANVFATLPRQRQGQVAEQLCGLVPLYADADVRPSGPGRHRIVFQDRWEKDIWYEPTQVSDGTIITLALLCLPQLERPVDILCIEEPEHGLHPYLLAEAIAMLRKLSRGELGAKAVQVVIATHSAQLLDLAEPEEVRFVTRSLEDGATQVQRAPTDTDGWKAAYEEYQQSLGDMWLSGGLGGVPGAAT